MRTKRATLLLVGVLAVVLWALSRAALGVQASANNQNTCCVLLPLTTLVEVWLPLGLLLLPVQPRCIQPFLMYLLAKAWFSLDLRDWLLPNEPSRDTHTCRH